MSMLKTIAVALAVVVGAAAPAAAGIEILEIRFNPNGKDTGKNAHLNREYVFVENTGSEKRSLRGWKLHDRGRDHVYRFGRIMLAPGDYLRVHSGRGETVAGSGCNGSCHSFLDLYWGLDEYVWGNRTDTATLRDRKGAVVDRCHYGKAAKSPKTC